MKRALKIVVATLALLYLGDYLSVRYRIPNHREPLTTVQIDVYYAIRLKGHKTEFLRVEPETETCVYSLFPQIGYLPCWYVARHKQKWVEIGQWRKNSKIRNSAPGPPDSHAFQTLFPIIPVPNESIVYWIFPGPDPLEQVVLQQNRRTICTRIFQSATSAKLGRRVRSSAA